ncbi:MAG: NPXTG-anchored protein [Oscillospiraceae bacterium]|nr:NPXTG-anchored protein [Oscillospiraceae bacterium]
MKMRSILASLGACAIAVSAMAFSASAAITNKNADNNYMYPIIADEGTNLPEGCKLSDVYGFEAKLSATASGEQTCVGAFCWQSDSNNWDQHEFCQEGGDKDVFIGSDGTVKWVSSVALFKDSDTWGKAFVAEWSWADDKQIDFAVESFKLLDKDGNELGGAPTQNDQTDAPKNDNTTAPANNTTAPANNNTTAAGSTKTGDAGVGVAVGVLALAGVAAVASRKKH